MKLREREPDVTGVGWVHQLCLESLVTNENERIFFSDLALLLSLILVNLSHVNEELD